MRLTQCTCGVDTYTYKNRQSYRSTHRSTHVQSRLPQQLPLHRPSYCCRALFRQCSHTSVHCSVKDRVDWQELTQGITWSTSRRYLAWWRLRPSPPAAMPCHLRHMSNSRDHEVTSPCCRCHVFSSIIWRLCTGLNGISCEKQRVATFLLHRALKAVQLCCVGMWVNSRTSVRVHVCVCIHLATSEYVGIVVCIDFLRRVRRR